MKPAAKEEAKVEVKVKTKKEMIYTDFIGFSSDNEKNRAVFKMLCPDSSNDDKYSLIGFENSTLVISRVQYLEEHKIFYIKQIENNDDFNKAHKNSYVFMKPGAFDRFSSFYRINSQGKAEKSKPVDFKFEEIITCQPSKYDPINDPYILNQLQKIIMSAGYTRIDLAKIKIGKNSRSGGGVCVSQAAIVTFDRNDPKSFALAQEFIEHKEYSKIPIITLVGISTDQDQKTIPLPKKDRDFLEARNIYYFEYALARNPENNQYDLFQYFCNSDDASLLSSIVKQVELSMQQGTENPNILQKKIADFIVQSEKNLTTWHKKLEQSLAKFSPNNLKSQKDCQEEVIKLYKIFKQSKNHLYTVQQYLRYEKINFKKLKIYQLPCSRDKLISFLETAVDSFNQTILDFQQKFDSICEELLLFKILPDILKRRTLRNIKKICREKILNGLTIILDPSSSMKNRDTAKSKQEKYIKLLSLAEEHKLDQNLIALKALNAEINSDWELFKTPHQFNDLLKILLDLNSPGEQKKSAWEILEPVSKYSHRLLDISLSLSIEFDPEFIDKLKKNIYSIFQSFNSLTNAFSERYNEDYFKEQFPLITSYQQEEDRILPDDFVDNLQIWCEAINKKSHHSASEEKNKKSYYRTVNSGFSILPDLLSSGPLKLEFSSKLSAFQIFQAISQCFEANRATDYLNLICLIAGYAGLYIQPESKIAESKSNSKSNSHSKIFKTHEHSIAIQPPDSNLCGLYSMNNILRISNLSCIEQLDIQMMLKIDNVSEDILDPGENKDISPGKMDEIHQELLENRYDSRGDGLREIRRRYGMFPVGIMSVNFTQNKPHLGQLDSILLLRLLSQLSQLRYLLEQGKKIDFPIYVYWYNPGHWVSYYLKSNDVNQSVQNARYYPNQDIDIIMMNSSPENPTHQSRLELVAFFIYNLINHANNFLNTIEAGLEFAYRDLNFLSRNSKGGLFLTNDVLTQCKFYIEARQKYIDFCFSRQRYTSDKELIKDTRQILQAASLEAIPKEKISECLASVKHWESSFNHYVTFFGRQDLCSNPEKDDKVVSSAIPRILS